MTKVLLIENGSRHTVAFAHFFASYEVKRVKYSRLTMADVDWADILVLSGGHPSVIHHHWFFRKQLELIRTTRKPIVGVCLGFELIARAFDVSPRLLLRKVHGLRTVAVAGNTVGLNQPQLKVWEGHRWTVPRLPEDFRLIASSTTGIEMMQHCTRPIIATQFHPEVHHPTNDGAMVLGIMMAEATKAL